MKPSKALDRRREIKESNTAIITYRQHVSDSCVLNQDTSHQYQKISDSEFMLIRKPQWK